MHMGAGFEDSTESYSTRRVLRRVQNLILRIQLRSIDSALTWSQLGRIGWAMIRLGVIRPIRSSWLRVRAESAESIIKREKTYLDLGLTRPPSPPARRRRCLPDLSPCLSQSFPLLPSHPLLSQSSGGSGMERERDRERWSVGERATDGGETRERKRDEIEGGRRESQRDDRIRSLSCLLSFLFFFLIF